MKFTVLILFALAVFVIIPDTEARYEKSSLRTRGWANMSNTIHSRHVRRSSDDEPISRTTGFIPVVTDAQCIKQGYCEHLDDYPDLMINELVDQLGPNWKYFVDKTDSSHRVPLKGVNSKMWNLCNSTEQLLSLKAARNHVDPTKWHYVLHGEPYDIANQKFRVEICQAENQPCSDVVGVYQGYKTTCMQKYQLRRVTIVNDQGALDIMDVMLPSSCACTIKIEDVCPMQCSLPHEPQKIPSLNIN